MKVAILQSNYSPWLGYFALMASVDTFVIYDQVQFTKNDWRNRNRVLTRTGPLWLTVPCSTSGRFGQLISDTQIAKSDWAQKHIGVLKQVHSDARKFPQQLEWSANLLKVLGDSISISLLNSEILRQTSELFAIRTRIIDSSKFDLSGDRNERLIGICRQLGANTYVSGPAGASYLDLESFGIAAIDVEFFNYEPVRNFLSTFYSTLDCSFSFLDLLSRASVSQISHFLGSEISLSQVYPWPQ